MEFVTGIFYVAVIIYYSADYFKCLTVHLSVL